MTTETPQGSANVNSEADWSMPRRPAIGFHGRDEALLALDRTFDSHSIVLLQASAGAGKTATASEFARWYHATGGLRIEGGVDGPIIFSTFEYHRTLDRLLSQFADAFTSVLLSNGIAWDTLSAPEQRALALQILRLVPALWIWDNAEQITGFPRGSDTPWSREEQDELRQFLCDVADTKGGRVLLTSRRGEESWLGDLPVRVPLQTMRIRDQFQLAQALAERHNSQNRIDFTVWLPLLRLSGGNPLTLRVVAGYALRQGIKAYPEMQKLVDEVSSGKLDEPMGEDRLGRSDLLSLSLDYGFNRSFTTTERSQLGVLHLFRGLVHSNLLVILGDSAFPDHLTQFDGITVEQSRSLLNRAAEIGLLEPMASGFYRIHPALPWYFSRLYAGTIGISEDGRRRAVRGYLRLYFMLGLEYDKRYQGGDQRVVDNMEADESNLLNALQLSRSLQEWEYIAGIARGLRSLYGHQGRTAEWVRIVDLLMSDMIDPDSGRPVAGAENQYSELLGYRMKLAQAARDWKTVMRLQQLLESWSGEYEDAAKESLYTDPESAGRSRLRSRAHKLETVGIMQREQGDARCIGTLEEAYELYRACGERRSEAVIEFNIAAALVKVSGLRNLDEADRRLVRSFHLHADDDQVGRGRVLATMGLVEWERFNEAMADGLPQPALLSHLNRAFELYSDSLSLFSESNVADRAVNYQQLALIVGAAGDYPDALQYSQVALRLFEESGSAFEAGQVRVNIGVVYAETGRYSEALEWARAALRDFTKVGAGATINAENARLFINKLLQYGA